MWMIISAQVILNAETSVSYWFGSGFGSQLCRPLFREHYRPDLSKEDAVKLVEMCLRVACYRDSSTANKYQIAVCTEEGLTLLLMPAFNLLFCL